MKKINLLSEDMITILTISLVQLKSLKGINKLFFTNVIDDLNHEFIYDEVLSYILNVAFNPKNGFPLETRRIFYSAKNCWVIHNKLYQLLESSKSYWAEAGNFKLVLNLDTLQEGYFDCFIYYDQMKLNNLRTDSTINVDLPKNRNITTLRIYLFRKISVKSPFDRNFLVMSHTSLQILTKLITFSSCTGFYKWIDFDKKLVEPIGFSEIESAVNYGKQVIKNMSPSHFFSKKDYDLYEKGHFKILELTLKTFTEIDHNVQNAIERKQDQLKSEEKQATQAIKDNLAVKIESKTEAVKSN